MGARTLEQRNELAAKHFGAVWSDAAAKTGFKASRYRNHLRNAAENQEAIAPLKAAGASCATCKSLRRNPAGLKGTYCGIDSDHEGYTVARLDGLCRWFTPQHTAEDASGRGE